MTRHVFAADRPVFGLCFGGRGRVTKLDEAREWFGEQRELNVFHWHYEGFALPRRAKRMLFGYCSMNKGFVLGKHLDRKIHRSVSSVCPDVVVEVRRRESWGTCLAERQLPG